GRLLEKEELMRRLWPDSFVEEGSLAQNVSLLRKALGESDSQKFIETVTRSGYRFIASVRGVQDDAEIIVQKHSTASIAVEGKQEPDISESYVESGQAGAQKALEPGRRANGILRQNRKRVVLIVGLALAVVVAA